MKYNRIREFILQNFYKKPKILNNEETIEMIISNKYSIARFGDGEFFLMIKEKGFDFQKIDDKLSERLIEVFNSNERGLLIGIPKVFDKNDLKKRTKESREWWSNYLALYRLLWYKYIDFKKVYASSTFTRNYMGIEDKSICKNYFKSIKEIWSDRDILIIEGEYSRLGVGNDLFDNVNSIERILAPSKNAFDKYKEILNEAKKINKDKLIIIALGPTATILAYDLHKMGYQVLDMGHIDIEYEWFLQNSKKKTKIQNKYIFEANDEIMQGNFNNKQYEEEIVAIIN